MTKYPKSNQILVKNNKTNRKYTACFKDGQLGVYIYTKKGTLKEIIYEPSTFKQEYTILEMNASSKNNKSHNYHNKSVIYHGEFKCLIKRKADDCFYVNWHREEKGKPMTSKPFENDYPFMSISDFFTNQHPQ